MFSPLAATWLFWQAQPAFAPASGPATIPAASAPANPPALEALVTEPLGVLAIMLVVLASVFGSEKHPWGERFFRYVPSLLFCYLVPALLSTLGVLPHHSPVYDFIRKVALPACLVLLVLPMDLRGLQRLGPLALLLLGVATVSVMIGGLLSVAIMKPWLPVDAWRSLAALCGSWIGGGANMAAVRQEYAPPADQFTATIVVDVVVANLWMAMLLLIAGRHVFLDRRLGADGSRVAELVQRMTDYQARVRRVPTLADLILILAVAFGGAWLALLAVRGLIAIEFWPSFLSDSLGQILFCSVLGIVLSQTPVKSLDGAGASKVASLVVYLLVCTFGAEADFVKIGEHPVFVVTGLIWMSFHALCMLTAAWLLRSPMFFMAVGSQSCIGGAASAPIVAAAFHPSLAPVGALMAMVGYAIGTFLGLITGQGMRWILEM